MRPRWVRFAREGYTEDTHRQEVDELCTSCGIKDFKIKIKIRQLIQIIHSKESLSNDDDFKINDINTVNACTEEITIVFVGDSNVGKTSLIERFLNNTFTDTKLCTIDVDFHTKIQSLRNGDLVKLKIWDTAG